MYTYSCLRLRLFTVGDPSSAARVSLAMICLAHKAMSKLETSARGHVAKRQRQENPTSLTRSKHPMRPKSSSGNSLHRTAKASPTSMTRGNARSPLWPKQGLGFTQSALGRGPHSIKNAPSFGRMLLQHVVAAVLGGGALTRAHGPGEVSLCIPA